MTSSSLPASEGPRAFAAVDLGASSGRVVLGTYRDGALDMTDQDTHTDHVQLSGELDAETVPRRLRESENWFVHGEETVIDLSGVERVDSAGVALLLERLATLTERLTVLLSDRNQEQISQILANANAASAGFADAAPQMERTMAELQVTLREAAEALDQFETVTRSTDRIINQEGEAIARDLRSTLESASGAAKALEDTLNDARPATKQLTESTLPAAEATLRDLRATSKALRDVTEKIDEKGAGSLLSSQPLPDYKP